MAQFMTVDIDGLPISPGSAMRNAVASAVEKTPRDYQPAGRAGCILLFGWTNPSHCQTFHAQRFDQAACQTRR